MKIKSIICLLLAMVLLDSCHLYKKYERPDDLQVKGLYRDMVSDTDTLVADTLYYFGNVPWRQVFTDPILQSHIENALQRNADLKNAVLSVQQAEAALHAARLSYLPMFQLAPTGTIASWDKGKASQTYSLPLTASWQVDLFGQLLNPHRKAKVTYQQMIYYQQAVQTQIVATVANLYYTLLMLDKQLQISQENADIMQNMVETMEAMRDAAMTNSASVEQTRYQYAQILASLPDIKQSIRETENALCLILAEPAHIIARGNLEEVSLPQQWSTGIPLQLLSYRPDVKAAEMSLAASFYDTNTAHAAFYPGITITGQAGWTNSAGSAVVNPGKLLATVVGSLVQPVFYRGKLTAALKQAQAAEEQAKNNFQATLLSAGNEVSNAIFQYQMTSEKQEARKIQLESSKKAAEFTRELFNLGSSSYLEVLQAQQSYLSAQLSEVSDSYNRAQAVIALYQALGGGRETINPEYE